MEKSRFAASAGFAGSPLINQVFLDQLANEQADCSAGDTHAAREISAGYWLMLPDQIQCDAAVNLPSGGAGRYFGVPGIDLSAYEPSLLTLSPSTSKDAS